MANSTKQNLMELSTQLKLIKSMDYSEWSYGSSVLSLIALTFTIFLVGLMAYEFTAEIRRQMDDDDDDDRKFNNTQSSYFILDQSRVYPMSEFNDVTLAKHGDD